MSWTGDMAAALPDNGDAAMPAAAPVEVAAEAAASDTRARDHGWAPKSAYDYVAYNKSAKDLADAQAAFTGEEPQLAVGGLPHGKMAYEAAVYEWNDEFGDVGPRFEELEKQLFGAENHVRAGINFQGVQSLEVFQEGSLRVSPVRKFEDAALHPIMLQNVKLAGYEIPTPIQQYCLPAVANGHDIVACAQTGSGKTAAFLIPILSKLMGKAKKLAAPRPNPATFQAGLSPGVRAEPLVLIVCPTRELATQIFDEARRFCYRTMLRPCVIYGGGRIGDQIMQLSKGCDLLIGTPGRLVDFINRPHVLTLKRLKYMVIDEADEMVGPDWEAEMKTIMSGGDQEEGNIGYMMFSATFPKICRDLAKEHLSHDHLRIRVGRAGSSTVNIKQDIVFCEASQKRQAVFDLLLAAPVCRTLIFVNSQRTADEVDDYLYNVGSFPCTSIHSGRTQLEREDSIRAFRSGKIPIMIATGVSARGLDIHNVLHVINYDLPSPQFGGIEEYTHRIGRTGRIGNIGLATSFYNERDADLAEALVKTMLETHQVIPDFLMSFIPDGFTADGEGDVNLLKFEADSDYGEENAGESTEAGGGSGWFAAAAPAQLANTGGWDQSAAPSTQAPAGNGWVGQGEVSQSSPVTHVDVVPIADAPAANTWSAQPEVLQTSPVNPVAAAPVNSWSATPANNPTGALQQSWGAPTADVPPPASQQYWVAPPANAPQAPLPQSLVSKPVQTQPAALQQSWGIPPSNPHLAAIPQSLIAQSVIAQPAAPPLSWNAQTLNAQPAATQQCWIAPTSNAQPALPQQSWIAQPANAQPTAPQQSWGALPANAPPVAPQQSWGIPPANSQPVAPQQSWVVSPATAPSAALQQSWPPQPTLNQASAPATAGVGGW